MNTHYGVITGNKFEDNLDLRVSVTQKKERFSLQVFSCEKSTGFFVLQPDGSINTITSKILQKELEQIGELTPEMIMFDMKHVNYINTHGLHVILEAVKAIKRRGGRVTLKNCQTQIKKVFDILGVLPKHRIFANRHELKHYLDTMQNRCPDDNYITEYEERNEQLYYLG